MAGQSPTETPTSSGGNNRTPTRRGRRARLVAVSVVTALALALGAWAWLNRPARKSASSQPASAGRPPSSGGPASAAPTSAGSEPAGQGPRFEDFVGAEACAACHAKEYALWKDSTHGRAGGRPGEVQVIARFDGQPLRFSDAVVTPSRTPEGGYVFHIDEPGEPRMTVPVDAVVGGGHMHGGGTQSFFQRQVDGTWRFLPFDFIRREGLWFVQLRRDMTWAPISERISLFNDLANWPPRRVLGTASEFSNCQNCHGSQITLQHDANAHAYETRFQTLRINCESCHGPGRRHIEIVKRPGWDKETDLGLPALATIGKKASMNTCHQCHATKDALRDDPYLPGANLEDFFSLKLALLTESPFLADGRIRSFGYQSNHEYSDCYLNGSMTCTDCHDPHSQGYRDVFGRPLAGRFDNGQCTGCHASKGLSAEAHSHHRADSPGNLCVGCHMPYLQHQGVGQHLMFARSDHSIPIPRPAFDHGLGIENACQKCHRDHDLAWQQAAVDRWWGRLKPHPALIANLARTNPPATTREAAASFLDPAARHPMAQAAGLARFIEQQIKPGLPAPDPEVLRRLRDFTENPDADLQAFALTALQIGYGRHPEARRLVDGALQRTTDHDPVRRRWAIAADHLGATIGTRGDAAAALACFNAALEVQPRNEVILSHAALARLRLGDADAAIATLRRAVDIRPTKAVLHFQLAQACAQAGRLPEAIAALQAGLQHAPYDENARRMLEQLTGAPRRP